MWMRECVCKREVVGGSKGLEKVILAASHEKPRLELRRVGGSGYRPY